MIEITGGCITTRPKTLPNDMKDIMVTLYKFIMMHGLGSKGHTPWRSLWSRARGRPLRGRHRRRRRGRRLGNRRGSWSADGAAASARRTPAAAARPTCASRGAAPRTTPAPPPRVRAPASRSCAAAACASMTRHCNSEGEANRQMWRWRGHACHVQSEFRAIRHL